ncbi:MAG: translation initiation factor IF-6 [Candidatus ainarchaeum sp.]|nr:translation initiation factor IF-6 [Candidatus ainarchaeum sp.]
MQLKRIKILGSNYIGLFAIANDKLCFVPNSIEEKIEKEIERILNVKTIKTSIYDSALIAVFAKMNNKEIILPNFVTNREINEIEKEIKVRLIETEHALGNLIEINDKNAIISKTLNENDIKQLKKTKLKILQTNLAKTDAIGSSIIITNKAFLISPNATKEEVKKVQDSLNIKGGASTANTGDSFIRNSIIANKNGILVGEQTTGHEMNRIEEVLGQEE